MSEADRVKSNSSKWVRRRNPFPDGVFFHVPTALYDSGLARLLRPSELVRYLTFLRIANYSYGRTTFMATLDELEKLDGIAPRTAWLVHRKLQDFGLIKLLLTCRPYAYMLCHPRNWSMPHETPRFVDTNPLKIKLTAVKGGSVIRVPKDKTRTRKERNFFLNERENKQGGNCHETGELETMHKQYVLEASAESAASFQQDLPRDSGS